MKPGGEVDRVADGEVFQVLVIADPTQDDQSAMDPDPHLEIVHQAAQLQAIFFQLVLDVEGGVDGALRIIFVGDGRAEEGQDAITEELGDRAVVAADGFADDAVRA